VKSYKGFTILEIALFHAPAPIIVTGVLIFIPIHFT
jgi:hypothetical protein